jgi:hypothetical protein
MAGGLVSAGPRHSRKEIRDFAAWMRKQGWTYESTDAKGHTLWSHPKSPSLYKLAETPKHFNVQLSRRDVLRLMGEKVEGKRRPKQPGRGVTPQRVIFDEAQRFAGRSARPAPVKRKTARRLPWEGADQPDGYDYGLARLMREIPGR